MAKSTAILAPNYGLYLGQPSISIPDRGLEDCNNIRIKRGRISNRNLGWTTFADLLPASPVALIDQFLLSDGTIILIAGTLLDLFKWTGTKFLYLTPIYATGNATTTGASSTVEFAGGTDLITAGIKAGDYIYLHTAGSATQTDPAPASGAWFPVASVTDLDTLVVTGTPPAITNQPFTIRKTFQTAHLHNSWRTVVFPNADAASLGGGVKDRWYATNVLDYPVVWDGIAAQVEVLSGLTFRCSSLVRYKNMLLYLNINDDADGPLPHTLRNSDVGKPETMAGGLSGEFVVAPGTAQIIAGVNLGDDVAVYTNEEIAMVNFVGSPDIFAFRTAVTGSGLTAHRLIAQFGDHHQFIARDAAYDFDGNSANATDNHVWLDVLRRQDQARIDHAHSVFDEENGELIYAIPLTSDTQAGDDEEGPENAFVQHYLENSPITNLYTQRSFPTPYTKRDFPFTATGFYLRQDTVTWDTLTGPWSSYNFAWGDRFLSAAFPILLTGDINGHIYTYGTVDHQNGVGYVSFATFGRRWIGDYRNRNLVTRVYPFTRQFPAATYSLTTTLTVYDHEGQSTGQSEVIAFDLTLPSGAADGGSHFVAPYRRGRIAQFQIGTAGSADGQPWEFDGYDWDIKGGGQ